MEKRFVLGMGAQKSGSSWLQAYLNADAHANFGRLGEYQIWESRYLPEFSQYKVPEPSLLRKATGHIVDRLGRPAHGEVLRWRMQQDPEAYFEYFARILQNPQIALCGDITPSYAALRAEHLHEIKNGFATRGIAVRAAFVMRDPVARIRSQFDMEIRKGRIVKPDTGAYGAALVDFAQSRTALLRSDYAQTLETLATVFAPDDIFLALFEQLFEPSMIARLSGFFDVANRPEAGQEQVNAQTRVRNNDPECDAAIARLYTAQYDRVFQDFPQINTLWPSAGYLLKS